MKIYKVGYCYDAEKDDFPFRGMATKSEFDYFAFSGSAPQEGSVMPMEWFDGDDIKDIGAALYNCQGFLIVDSSLSPQIRKYLPSAKVIHADIDGDTSKYVVFAIAGYEDFSQTFDHYFFLLFDHLSETCCTENFKTFWESEQLTGLDFKLIGIFDDHLFPPVGENNDQVC